MKRTFFLRIALLALLATPVALAQQSVQPPAPGVEMPALPNLNQAPGTEIAPKLQVEQGYGWFSNILRRYGQQANGSTDDTNRVGLTVPIFFTVSGSKLEIRGNGQIFAPSVLFNYYSPSVYNATSWRIFDPSDSITDQDYIDQFKGAGAYTVDSVIHSIYRNPSGFTPNFGAKFVVYRSSYNFNSSTYKSSGIVNLSRKAQTVIHQTNISPDGLDSTLSPDGKSFVRMVERYDPPLDAGAGESMYFMFINDDAPAIDGANVPSDAEIQTTVGTLGYRSGEFGTPNTFADSIPAYKTMGLLLFRINGRDSLNSCWSSGLNYGGTRAITDVVMSFFGTVDLTSGVKYHFGTEAKNQGLGDVSPNPVAANGRVPFTLTKAAHVKIDLYSADGMLVKTLVNDGYPAGVYSADLGVSDLTNGAYRVRMVTGSNVYSTSVIVAK